MAEKVLSEIISAEIDADFRSWFLNLFTVSTSNLFPHCHTAVGQRDGESMCK